MQNAAWPSASWWRKAHEQHESHRAHRHRAGGDAGAEAVIGAEHERVERDRRDERREREPDAAVARRHPCPPGTARLDRPNARTPPRIMR